MENTVSTRVDNAIAKGIAFFAKEEKVDKSTQTRRLLDQALKGKWVAFALEKYRHREITAGKAAELAKIPLADFIMQAAKEGIPLNYTAAELSKDFKAVFK